MDQVEKFLRDNSSFNIGVELAKVQIAEERLGWREHGKLVSWWTEASSELWERYGIQFEKVGDCITPIDIAAEASGYNQEMELEIIRRFGMNVIDAVFRELERKKKKTPG